MRIILNRFESRMQWRCVNVWHYSKDNAKGKMKYDDVTDFYLFLKVEAEGSFKTMR